jgi:hypothetical protein
MSTAASPLDRIDLLRVCQVRASEPQDESSLRAVGDPVTSQLELGRLAEFIDSADEIAPRIAAVADRAELELAGGTWHSTEPVAWQRLRIDIAGGGMVDVRILAVPWTDLPTTVGLLEDLYYERLQGEPAVWDSEAIGDVGRDPEPTQPFHQLVFLPRHLDEPSWDTAQRLIYRVDLDARPEFSSILQPDELNRRPGQGAYLSTFGSVVWRQQSYVEASLIISAALTVSATASLQVTRARAHDALRQLHQSVSDDDHYANPSRRQILRNQLVRTQEIISLLEAELTFGAEASATIKPLLPSLRTESFHRSLYTAAEISQEAARVDRMLNRLRASCEAELSALQAVEDGINQLRARRWSIGGQILAVVAVPLSLILAYFGISTADVAADSSLYDIGTYWTVYTVVLALIFTSALVIVLMHIRDYSRAPQSTRTRVHLPPKSSARRLP